MKATLLAGSCILAFPLIAQDAPRRVGAQPRAPSGTLQSPGESEALKNNITIRLHGTTTTGADLDLSLSGIGPMFTADQVVNDDTMLTCQYVVSETETGYRVSYSISARIKIATQTSQSSTNFEYRDVSVSGTVLCSADRPQALVRNGSKPLQLTITKETEPESP
jgi:hypothetical protein